MLDNMHDVLSSKTFVDVL